MKLDEISIAFQDCTGNAPKTLKSYLLGLGKPPQEYEDGFLLNGLNNYILSDVEKLLSKTILNLLSSDVLLQNGYFSWSFVTAYYASFFAIQALNRLQLQFYTWIIKNTLCEYQSSYQEIKFKGKDQSGNTHVKEFDLFFKNYDFFKQNTSRGRYWNIAIRESKHGYEPDLRNKINYVISNEYYNELEVSLSTVTVSKSPFVEGIANSPDNIIDYARQALAMGIARFRVVTDILRHMAEENDTYHSHFQRNMRNRLKMIEDKYSHASNWIIEELRQGLEYQNR